MRLDRLVAASQMRSRGASGRVWAAFSGARAGEAPFYGSLSSWYFDADASHLAAGRRYRICTDLDGRLGPMAAGDTGFEVFVNPLEATEGRSLVHGSGTVQVQCGQCLAAADTLAPSFVGAESYPPHGADVSRLTNVILAFSEVWESIRVGKLVEMSFMAVLGRSGSL